MAFCSSLKLRLVRERNSFFQNFVFVESVLGTFSFKGWWQMVPRKLQASKTFNSISKYRNGICDEYESLVFVSFLEYFEIFAVKCRIFFIKVSASSGLPRRHSFGSSRNLSSLRDEPKECLRGRLGVFASLGFFHSPSLIQNYTYCSATTTSI